MGILFGLRRNRRPRPAESTANTRPHSGLPSRFRIVIIWHTSRTLASSNAGIRKLGRKRRSRRQLRARQTSRPGPAGGGVPCEHPCPLASASRGSSSRLGGGAAGGGRAGRAASVGGLRRLSILGAASLTRPTRSLRVSFSNLPRDGLRRHRVRLRRRVSSSPQKSRIINSRVQLPMGDRAIPPLPACWSRAEAMTASPARSEGRDAPTQPPPKSAYIPNRTHVTQLEEGPGAFRIRARRSRFVQKSEYRLRCGP
jgi:hypothetical protein